MKKLKKLFIGLLFGTASLITFAADPNYEDYKALLIGNNEGGIVKSVNAETVRPLASITKVMTSLLVLEEVEKGKINLDTKVIVSEKAAVVPYGIKLVAGKEYTVRDLLKAMIIRSSNNAAYALGEFIGGDIPTFVSMMNKKANELGLDSLRYCSPHGLPPKYTGSCMDQGNAKDLYKLGMYMTKYNEYFNISKNSLTYIDNGEIQLKSTNHLLGKVVGVDGMKTGYHDASGSNIILTAKRGEDRMYAVILGATKAANREAIGEKEINEYYEKGKNYIQEKVKKIGMSGNNNKNNSGKNQNHIVVVKIIDKNNFINKVVINNEEYGLYPSETVYDTVNFNEKVELDYQVISEENITRKSLNEIVGIFYATNKKTKKVYSGALILKEIKK